MGIVYRGRDAALERDVALKVMSLGQGDAEARTRFEREAKAAAKLQTPYIVTIYELGAHQGSPFIAMELLEGIDLQRAIEEGLRPDPRITLPIILQLLAGLGHAHESGIIHRDIKPSNVFLPRNRPAKIMDFGVARLVGGLTTAGMVVGTPNYMSPEQVGSRPLDGRSDLFSAGLILYELVTGEKAYQADSVVSILYKIAHEDPDLSLIPRGPQWERLRGVLKNSLAHDPDDRYPDARAMSLDLAAALQDLGGSMDWATVSNVVLRTTPRPSPILKIPEAIESPSALPAREAPTPPRKTLVPVVAALSGISIAIVFGVVLLRRGLAPPVTSPSAPLPSLTPPSTAPATPVTAPTLVPSPRAVLTTTPPSPVESKIPLLPSPPPQKAAASPEDAPAGDPLERANAFFAKGNYAAAMAEAKAALRRDPSNAEARTLVEDAEAALVVESRLKSAREALRRGDKEAALEAIRAGLAVAPNDSRLIALFKEATQ